MIETKKQILKIATYVCEQYDITFRKFKTKNS